MKTILLFLMLISLNLYGFESDNDGMMFDRFKRLGIVESDNRDNAIGTKGEISRYQILPSIWVKYFGKRSRPDEKNCITAMHVAELIMDDRVKAFVKRYKKEPTDEQWLILWHAPSRINKPTKSDRSMAERFVALKGKYD